MASWDLKLLKAAEKGSIKEVELCIKNGANLECRDPECNSRAAYQDNGFDENGMYLYSSGPLFESLGPTPLLMAAKGGHLDVVSYLVNRGSNVEAITTDGDNALHYAAMSGQIDITKLLIEHGCLWVKNDSGKTPYELAASAQHFNGRKVRDILKDYNNWLQLGLPVEVNQFDKSSAGVFASLLEEEGYCHYEARVMLAGEQGTGKTTIARYLVGKGPRKFRLSTDGINLYNGLSFINREAEEWMQGKQDFTLSEVAISRALPQNEDSLTKRKKKGSASAQVEVVSDGLTQSPLSSESLSPVAENDKCCDSTTAIDLLRSDEIHPREKSYINNEENDPFPVQSEILNSKLSSYRIDIGQPSTERKISEKKKNIRKAAVEPSPVILEQSFDDTKQRRNIIKTPPSVLRQTTPDILNVAVVPTTALSVPAKETQYFSYADMSLTITIQLTVIYNLFTIC